jgi:putative membrane protein
VAAALVALAMAAVLVLYVAGVRTLWRSAGDQRGVSRRTAAAFVAGWLVLCATLFGPIDALGGELFTAHMIQHELMMLVAAPLLALGAPLAVASWGVPRRSLPAIRGVTRAIAGSHAWRAITHPFGAWLLHAIVLWAWHMPRAFEAALRDAWIHDLQHATFLASALLFWWALVARRTRTADGVAVLYLFTTMIHTGALGALLTFSPTVWYGSYAGGFGMSALEDQQAGGLVMWIPGGTVYLAAGVYLLGRWLLGATGTRKAPAGGDSGPMYAADR